MASRALIYYSNSSGEYISLLVEQSTNNSVGVFTEATVEQFANDIKPLGMDLVEVRFSSEYEKIYP